MLKEKINEYLSNKSILILGFGREGKSTLNYIMTSGVITKRLAIADKSKDIEKLDGIEYFLGASYLEALQEFDIIIKAPGISLKDVDMSLIQGEITSQTDLFLTYGGSKVIGITGTKGKSTTTTFIHQMLKEEGFAVELVGNIGVPALDYVDKYDETKYFVYELSSHQLELVHASPKIAVFLNLYEEHLDYYSSFLAYANAKRNIFKYQSSENYLVYNKDMESKLLASTEVKSKRVPVSQEQAEKSPLNNEYVSILCDIQKIHVLGTHNLYNLTVAATVAKLVGVSDKSIVNAIEKMQPLPHRLQTIGEFNGVRYIDDSISTIPEATISAIQSIDGVDTVLIGGMDRGINYDNLIQYLATTKTQNIILMYDSGKRIYEALRSKHTKNNIIYAEDLERAIELAVNLTQKGKICLLSPAAASYGFFKNFEERGDKFKEFVKKYSDS